jgi:hypothetical protein
LFDISKSKGHMSRAGLGRESTVGSSGSFAMPTALSLAGTVDIDSLPKAPVNDDGMNRLMQECNLEDIVMHAQTGFI